MSIRRKPGSFMDTPVCTAVSVICLLVFCGIQIVQAGNQTENAILLGAFYKPMILAGEWWRLLSCGFVHQTAMHLLVNLWSLSIMGKMLEKTMGSVRFAVLLLSSIIGGSFFMFAMQGNTIAVGLSGGLYGCMSAYIYLLITSGALHIPMVRTSLITMVCLNLLINLMPNVAVIGHLGGAITGILVMVLLNKNPEMRTMRINSAAALAVLILCTGYIAKGNAYIRQDQSYPGTDVNVLKAESEFGSFFQSHADKMIVRLDDLYNMNGALVVYYEKR